MISHFIPGANKSPDFPRCYYGRKKQVHNLGAVPSSSNFPPVISKHTALSLLGHLLNKRLKCSRSYPSPCKLLLMYTLVPRLLAVIKCHLNNYVKHEQKTKKKGYKGELAY